MVAVSAHDCVRRQPTERSRIERQTDRPLERQGDVQRTDATQRERRPVDPEQQQAARRGALASEQEVRARTQTVAPEGVNLRRGARGPEVEALQRALNERGANPPLEVDGRFGPLTAGAVREYQRANPPLATDGVVGPRTRASLARPPSETNPIGTQQPGGPQNNVDQAGLDAMNPRNMTAQQAAQALLNSPNVSFWGGLSTGSDRVQLERIARGENPRVPAHGPNATTTINPNMLRALVAMSREGRIQINALTGGSHSTNSNHYRGDSVDMQPGVGLSTSRIRQIAAEYGGVKNNEAHIHLTFRR
jgi:peptidoglycan hydrolase-like protein with peptidoglycan-binding domain